METPICPAHIVFNKQPFLKPFPVRGWKLLFLLLLSFLDFAFLKPFPVRGWKPNCTNEIFWFSKKLSLNLSPSGDGNKVERSMYTTPFLKPFPVRGWKRFSVFALIHVSEFSSFLKPFPVRGWKRSCFINISRHSSLIFP